MTARVAWVGLGAMGAPMASCVAGAGNDVRAYDIDPRRACAIAGPVLARVASLEAAAEAKILVVMMATQAQVESVLFGTGMAAALERDATVLIMSTVGPAAVEGWAGRLAGQGVSRAATGDLLVMVGGPSAAVKRCLRCSPPWRATRPSWERTLGRAEGQARQPAAVRVHIAVAGEALGLDAAACLEVLRRGAAASFMLEDRGTRMMQGAFEPSRSALDIFVKDMGLVVGAARDSGFPVPLAEAAEQLYVAARRAGLGRLDDSALIRIQREMNDAGPTRAA